MTRLKRSQLAQVFAGLEARQGTPVVLPDGTGQTNANSLEVLDFTMQRSQEMEDTRAASASISRGRRAAGQSTGESTFGTFVKGSGTLGVPPRFGRFLRACGFNELAGGAGVAHLNVTGRAGGSFRAGEIIEEAVGSPSWRALCLVTTDEATVEVYVEVLEGTPAASDNVRGVTSGATGQLQTTPMGAGGVKYKPVSRVSSTLALAGTDPWTGTPQLGEVLTGQTSGAQAVLLSPLAITGPGSDLILVGVVHGAFADGEQLRGENTNATANTAGNVNQAQFETPSLTLYGNRDGYVEALTGARGTVEFPFRAGQTLRANFTMRGQHLDHGDYPLNTALTQIGDTTRNLLFASAYVRVAGIGCVPLSELTLNMSAEVAFVANPCGAGGIEGAQVVDREPTITINPHAMPKGVIDWNDLQDSATTFEVFVMVGNTPGNRFGLYVPAAQVIDSSDADDSGTWRKNITALCTKESLVGDDEVLLYAL